MIGSQLQTAIYAKLIGDDLANGRVYDGVPKKPTFPYITIGDETVTDASNTCDEGQTVYPDIHVWSRSDEGSKVEVKDLAATVVASLRAVDTVTGHEVILVEHDGTRIVKDRDGLTNHAIVTMRFEIQPE